MDEPLQDSVQQFLDSLSLNQTISAMSMGLYMLIGGVGALYLRWLYRTFATSASDSDSVTRVFPLLTLATIGVIAVVKSSMALSLGLVGALSIVRFRSAIKEPEELVYLFLCIGIGLMLGNGQPLLALSLLIVATLFILMMYWIGKHHRAGATLLTVSGAAIHAPDQLDASLFQTLRQWNVRHQLQRMDMENGVGQVRLLITGMPPSQAIHLLAQLQRALPDCELNLVQLGTHS